MAFQNCTQLSMEKNTTTSKYNTPGHGVYGKIISAGVVCSKAEGCYHHRVDYFPITAGSEVFCFVYTTGICPEWEMVFLLVINENGIFNPL